jgi:hypothetical protein
MASDLPGVFQAIKHAFTEAVIITAGTERLWSRHAVHAES